MVSPIAHRVFDFVDGHCSVSVFVHRPSASREKRPDDSTPATECVIVLEGTCVAGGDNGVEVKRCLTDSSLTVKSVDVEGEGVKEGGGSTTRVSSL